MVFCGFLGAKQLVRLKWREVSHWAKREPVIWLKQKPKMKQKAHAKKIKSSNLIQQNKTDTDKDEGEDGTD